MKPPISPDSQTSHGSRILVFVIFGVIVVLFLVVFLMRTPVGSIHRAPTPATPSQH